MKTYLILPFLLWMLDCSGQTQELKQLSYDMQKLLQYKAMLDKMVKGYEILSNGYNTISNLSKGNFDLHNNYLDALWLVSPLIASDKRIAGILAKQATMVKEYQEVWQVLQSSTSFSVKELAKIKDQYANMIESGLQSCEDLSMVISSNKLRMNDSERLTAIGQIDRDMNNTYRELRSMNVSVNELLALRQSAKRDTKALRGLYGFQ